MFYLIPQYLYLLYISQLSRLQNNRIVDVHTVIRMLIFIRKYINTPAVVRTDKGIQTKNIKKINNVFKETHEININSLSIH